MRTPLLVGVVVAVHCVAVGSAVLIQGCRSTFSTKSEPAVTTQTAEEKHPDVAPQVVPPVVETPKAEQSLPPETTAYVVGNGDSLSVIAYKYGLKAHEIMALNTMTNPNKLRAGQKLLLPGKVNIAVPKRRHVSKKPKAVDTEEENKGEAHAGSGEEYKVEPGDSLSAIAVKYGTTVSAIKKANNLTSSALRAGQKLMIPGAVKKEKAVEPATVPTVPADAPAELPADAPVSVPVAPAVQPAVSAPETTSTPADGKSGITLYKVDQNEDLVKVARAWAVSVEDLKKLNGLTDITLTPGQVIKIPSLL